MEKLTIVSYNIWFDSRHIQNRVNKIIEMLGYMQPTIICLQEVTHATYSLLVDTFTKQGYQSCYKDLEHFKKIAQIGYGVLTLSKLPIISVNFVPFIETSMGRYFSVSKLQNGVTVINTHLESLGTNSGIRQKQIGQLIELINIIPISILTMDSNLTDKKDDIFPQNEGIVINDGFIIDGSNKDKEYTYDYKTNKNVLYKYQTRLDRIYYTKLKQLDFSLFGEMEIPEIAIPPSDHYGIRMVFELKN